MPAPSAPKVFTIAAGLPFADLLAAGIVARHGADPLALSRVIVLLPTRRACRALRDAFLRSGDGAPMLLPSIRPLGDVAEDELDIMAVGEGAAPLDLPPAMPDTRRLLLLAELLRRREETAGNPAMAVALADELADLLDAAATEGLSLDALEKLVGGDFAAHWRRTLEFLDVLRTAWPAILAEEGAMDGAARRNRVLRAQAEVWRASPPADPVYAAGSTGSIPATADLLGVVARLPQGAVILPGFDTGLTAADHTAINDDPIHPQHGMIQLLQRIGVDPREIISWSETISSPRAALLRAALAPADLTDNWATLPKADDAALVGLTLVEAPGAREEALAIALLMRQALEQPGRTAALVTPDRTLARRTAAELARWGIGIDDSAGLPLRDTPPASFARLIAAAAHHRAAPVALLALLKHPLASLGGDRAAFVDRARRLERAVLRGLAPAPGLDGVLAALKLKDKPDLLRWFTALADVLSPFFTAVAGPARAPAELLDLHIACAERLAGSDNLWRHDAGETLANLVTELRDALRVMSPVAGRDWPALFDALLAGSVVRPRFGRHPRLFIWGLLEARLQHADTLILGGLNEGVWPPEAAGDPWLSRPMRRDFGLPAPERRLGQTAHDFVQAVSASNVVLTRALKIDGTPTVPARWLLRLGALLNDDPRWVAARAAEPLSWAQAIDRPAKERPASPPAPRPPVALRPRKLSVTQVETLVRDPYATFARFVLRLKPLDPLEAEPSGLERGSAIHMALENFMRRHLVEDLPFDADQELIAEGRKAFAPLLDRPLVRTFWWPRFERIAAWFVRFERARRAGGARPLALEVKGQFGFTSPGGPFMVHARADRLDMLPDGHLAILDYKSGRPPSVDQVTSGFAPQLTLEAAIAAAGGFSDVPAGRVGELTFIRLSGVGEGGEEVVLGIGDPHVEGQAALQALRVLVEKYDDPAMPYRSRPRPQLLSYDGDYDHLARYAEWSGILGRAEP